MLPPNDPRRRVRWLVLYEGVVQRVTSASPGTLLDTPSVSAGGEDRDLPTNAYVIALYENPAAARVSIAADMAARGACDAPYTRRKIVRYRLVPAALP